MTPLPLAERHSVKTRVLRFCVSVAGLVYLRKTWTTLFQQHAMLRLQRGAAATATVHRRQSSMLWNTLKYTFSAQLIAASEYLIPLMKPLLAMRIGRLLVWKGPRVESNAVYGPHPRNTVDVYGVERDPTSSPTLQQEKKPVLVFVHGGAWSFGHKWQYGLVGEYLSTFGFVVAVVNYRTYPSGHVQDMVEDVEHAVSVAVCEQSILCRNVAKKLWWLFLGCLCSLDQLGEEELPSVRRRQGPDLPRRPFLR